MTYDELIASFQRSAVKHGYTFSASNDGWTVHKPKGLKESVKPIKDLVIDRYRASNDVTQHANAVRLTHVPTGTVTHCAEHRLYQQNLEAAMKLLRAHLERNAQMAKNPR